MQKLIRSCALLLAAAIASAHAASPLSVIDQVFSNGDGSVQFITVKDTGKSDCDSGEAGWFGLVLTSSGPAPTQTFTFPANLPTCRTSGRHILIATQGFSALGVVTPDFVIPNGFLQIAGGSIDFAGITAVFYASLPTDGVHAIDGNGAVVTNLAINLAGVSASVVAPASSTATVVEYYNASLDHFFITWRSDEIAKLDAGTQIKGWSRTGYSFRTYTSAQPATDPVCRFYIPPGLGDSHFFGRGTAECTQTAAKFPALELEDPTFMHMILPVQGTCPAATAKIYRVFSNRADANHRYTADPAVRDQMVAKGWIAEGDGADLVVMCAPQ